jgi:predicted metallopeptidase
VLALLIVGGYDLEVVELNRQTFDRLTIEKRLEIIPIATHIFEEAGALQARGCFQKYLEGSGRKRDGV